MNSSSREDIGEKEKERNIFKSLFFFFFFLFLFSDWIQCTPPPPCPEGGRVASESLLPLQHMLESEQGGPAII
jgi:hypothetical protein